MNCFQLVKTVLDEVYERIPEKEAQKDVLIKERLEYLSSMYAKLGTGKINEIDYEDDVTRFAYIYKYVTSHANYVYDIISNCKELQGIFDREKVLVSCIGGGPGSDFLGILKYMMERDKKAMLKCYLYDREGAWAESWSDVDDKLGASFQVSTYYQPLDVTDETSWTKKTKFLASDLFTLIFFMSEIYGCRKTADRFFQYMLSRAAEGSLILFVDNYNSAFYGWFDELVGSHHFEELKAKQGEIHIWDTLEEKQDLGVYYKKFGSPKLKSVIAYRVCRKN